MNISIIMRFHNDSPSGGRKIIYDYANYLASKGNKVEITFLADVPYKLRKYNLLKRIGHYLDFITHFKKQNKISWFALNPNIVLKARYNFKAREFKDADVVLAFDYGIALNIVEAGYTKEKIVYMIQHDEKVYNAEHIVRSAWRLPVQKVVVASWLYKLVAAYDKQVTLVKNYVRLKDFYVTKPIKDRRHVVSLINHPNFYKDTKTGMKALEIVHQAYPDLRVLLFGNSDKPNDLPAYVTYTQQADTNTLREKIYNQSSIFLLPSVLEGWGLVATEAMACGATLVSTRNGGVDDFGIDGETAMLNDVRDYYGLANSIMYLFTHDNERIRLGQNGEQLVSQLTFETSAKAFEKVLSAAARKGKSDG